MIARLQRWLILALMVCSLGCIAAASRGVWWWLIWPALLVSLHAGVLATELLMQRRWQHASGVRLTAFTAIPRLVLREVLVAWRIFGFEQPFGSRSVPDLLEGAKGKVGVLLVHGFFCNRSVWIAWARELRRQGIPFLAIDLEPPFGSIDGYSPLIESAACRLEAATGRPPVVVGHSMGGIALRAWLVETAACDRIQAAVTIGSPHGGTVLGRYSTSTNARQMALGSDWLAALAARESDDIRTRFVCFHSEADNVVIPWTSATLAGADNRLVSKRTHLDLIAAPEIFDHVLHLAGANPDPGRRPRWRHLAG